MNKKYEKIENFQNAIMNLIKVMTYKKVNYISNIKILLNIYFSDSSHLLVWSRKIRLLEIDIFHQVNKASSKKEEGTSDK